MIWELGGLERRVWVGIEVIVEVDTVDVVSLGDIGDDLEGMSLNIGEAWIHPLEIPIGSDPGGVGTADVCGVDWRSSRGESSSKRVKPSVQFEAALVSFVDCELERIVGWGGWGPHFAGEVFGPRFEFGGVESISGWADLEDDGVESEGLCLVENLDEFSFLHLGGEAGFGWPIDVSDGRDPEAPELTSERRG